MDAQGKHLKVTYKLVEKIEEEGGITYVPTQVEEPQEWTPELVEQRVRDEEKHWRRLAERAESPKISEETIPLRDQMRILRKGVKQEIHAMNATITAAEDAGKTKAAAIKAEAPAKVAAVRADLEGRLPPT